MVDAMRGKGPTVLLDAGNALFKGGGMGDPVNLARAESILGLMGELGTAVMPAGGRDLVGGVPLLKRASEKSGVKVLSANMRAPDGSAIFPASTILKVGGLRLGVIGLSPPGPVTTTEGVKCLEATKSALDEAAALRARTDVVLVLAAVPHADALALAQAAGDKIDFILESTERRTERRAQQFGSAWLVAGGDSGKALARLDLTVSGKGAFVEAAAAPAAVAAPRSFRLGFVELGADVAADPKTKAAVERVEPAKAP